MKKLIALILAFAMVFALTACGSSEPETTTAAPTEAATTAAPTTEAPTEAPTTAAPTTEAPTTEAPTTAAPTEAPTEAPTQSGKTDEDKAAFYADFKNNVGEFNFVGKDIRIYQGSEGAAGMMMVTAHNMVMIQVTKDEAESFAAMYENEGKLYIQTVLPKEGGDGSEEAWYVTDVPDGEDPLGEMSGTSTEDYTYEDNMTMEYLETVEQDGVVYDKVKVTTTEDGDEGAANFWFVEETVEVWKLEMNQVDAESGAEINAVMEFFTNEDGIPAYSTTPQELSYEEATMTFAMAMFSLLYGEMEIGD